MTISHTALTSDHPHPLLKYNRIMPSDVLSIIAEDRLHSGIAGTDQMVAILNPKQSDIDELKSLIGITQHNVTGLWYYHPNKPWTKNLTLETAVDTINKFHCFVGFSSEALVYATSDIRNKHNCNFGDMVVCNSQGNLEYDWILQTLKLYGNVPSDCGSSLLTNIKYYELVKPNMLSYLFMKVEPKSNDQSSNPTVFMYQEHDDLRFSCFQADLEYSREFWKGLAMDGYRQSHTNQVTIMPRNMQASLRRVYDMRMDYYEMQNEKRRLKTAAFEQEAILIEELYAMKETA